MRLEKKEIEEQITNQIVESLEDSNKPEQSWKVVKEHSLVLGRDREIFERNDGLRLELRDYHNVIFLNPVEYRLTSSTLEREIHSSCKGFKDYLKELERLEIEQKKLSVLSTFFGLDIKKQRKEKIIAIESEMDFDLDVK